MKKLSNKITPLEVNFSQWYTDLVLNGGLIDYGIVSGTMILKPHGFLIWKLIVQQLDKLFVKNAISEVYMPLLIPLSLLNEEKEHIAGFAPECAIINQVGAKQLNEPLVIRPTSEVLFCKYFAKNVTSYKDLPLKYNQWANVVRWEKTTRPFLRTSEFLWQEGHSVHNTAVEAKNWTLAMLNLYSKFFKDVLAIAVLKGKKSLLEKFAGAQDTYSLEALLLDGQSLQAATSHYFGQNFAQQFNISFTTNTNTTDYAYQTSWGLSTRVIGALIMSHSDNRGLVLPPKVAPIQVAIITIQDEPQVQAAAQKIYQQLKNKFRIVIDDTNKSPGYKFSNNEIKGVCFRIEIGKREIENNQVLIVARHTNFKELVAITDIAKYLAKNLKVMHRDLYRNSITKLKSRTYDIKTFTTYQETYRVKPGFFGAWFCNRIVCEEEIKNLTSTVSRCQDLKKQQSQQKCFKCQEPATGYFYFARAY